MWSFRIFLRQEFCELDILDEITELRYGGKLPDHIHGNFRSSLIRTYQKWKGTDYVPPLTHPALKWSIKDPLPLLLVVTDAPWQIIDEKKKKVENKKMEPKLQLRLNPQIFHMGLLQQREVCLSNAGKSENLKNLRI